MIVSLERRAQPDGKARHSQAGDCACRQITSIARIKKASRRSPTQFGIKRPLHSDSSLRYRRIMLVDPNNPFFDRLWVRLLCVLAPLGWAAVEFSNAENFWGGCFAAAGLYLAYALFWVRGRDRS
jgi:hypothetical protein